MSLKHFGGVRLEKQSCEDAKRQSLLRFELFRKIKKILDLIKRNILISPLEGEKKFLSELCELRNFREGYTLKYSCRNSNFDRRLYFLRNINYNSDMLHHDKNNKGRLGILAQHEAGFEPSPEFLSSPRLTKKFNPLTKREGSDSVISNNFSDTNHSQLTTHHSLKFKVAFTLAEVLITLGIIGVVSALTMPSLIQSYKEKVTVTKLEKAYSFLNQAYKRISDEYGEPQDWPGVEYAGNASASAASAHRDLYAQYVSCKKFKGQIYGTVDTTKKIKALNGELYTYIYYFPSFTNNDGTVFQFSSLRNCGGYVLSTGKLTACSMGGDILVDINGYEKGPNQLGKDIFAFVTAQTGVYPAGMIGSYTEGDCNLNGKGISCSEYVLREKNMKYLIAK